MSRYALIVGIGEYQSLKKLTKPKTDAQAVYDLLKQHGNFDEIHLLQDAAASYQRLSAQLEYVLITQASKAKAEVLLYFTGHGFTAGPSKYDQQGYLATHNCAVTKTDGVITHAEQAISFQFLNGLIGDADLSGLAIFLDCCHSEFFIEQALIAKNLSNCFEKPSYFLSTACRSFEQAWAERDEPHSVYTGALLQALRDETVEDIKASESHNKIQRQLKGSGQEPISFGLGNSLTVVAYRPAAAVVANPEDSPYQGLEAFTEKTAQFFFGREDTINQLLKKLVTSRFVLVQGPSGIGKSSVVRAGLVTHLISSGWQVVKMKPGKTPMAMLEEQLRALLESQPISTGTQRQLLAALGNDGGLVELAAQLPEDLKVLLLVDQFEEVFTLCESAAGQRKFIGELLQVGRTEGSRLAVVMTMRSDFSDDWLAAGYPPEAMGRDTVWLGALTNENLQAAIVKPAEKQGYVFEPGLLALLLADVAAEKNYLPLLEFALTELWDARDRQAKRLTVNAYSQMKGLKGALNKRAEDVYGNLRPAEQAWARRICLQLVRIGKGERDTRQRQPQTMLLQMYGPRDRPEDESEQRANPEPTQQSIADVVQDLVAGRLLVSDLGYLDLAHEALLEGWKRFALWRQEDRDLLRLVQRLEDAYEEWQEKGEDERYLLSGGLLLELKVQQQPLTEILAERRAGLNGFFLVSDEREQNKVAALAQARLQEKARKVREKFQAVPAQTVPMSLAAIELVGESQTWLNEVAYPATDTLHHTFSNIRERLKLEGHSGSVRSVAFSPQGDSPEERLHQSVISGSDDQTLRLWDLQGNPIGQPFQGHSGSVWSVAFSPQGDCIVSGSTDNTLRLWDLQGNPIGQPFEGHSDWVWSVAFSPQGDCIVSGSTDNTLRLWDLQGNPIGQPFEGHSDWVRSVAFSPQGDCIVSGSDDQTLRLWDLQGNPIGQPFEGHSGLVWSVAFSPQGDYIVSGSDDQTLRLWDLQGNPIGQPFQGHSDWVRSVAFSPQGDCIVSGSDDQTLRLWDLQGNPIGQPFEGHSNLVWSVAFSPQKNSTEERFRQCVVSGSTDRTLRLWDLQGDPIGQPFEGHNGSVLSVAFSPQGDSPEERLCQRIISGSTDQTLRLWDLQGNPIGQPFEGHSDWVRSVAFSFQGDLIVSGSDDQTLRLWDLQGNPIGQPFEGHSGSVRSVAFSPEGDRIVSGSADNKLRLWDLQGNPIGDAFVGHSGGVWSVAFSPQGDRIVSGSADNKLRLWDLQGNPIGDAFAGHSGSVRSVAFSPQGDRIVSGSDDNKLRLWDLQGNPIGDAFARRSSGVNSVAFSPQGDRIVSGSDDNKLQLWDLQGNPIGDAFAGHSGSVWSVAFSPQGDRIVSSSNDSTLRLWRCGTWEAELQHCCTMLMHHSALTLPQTETARKAGEVCQQVWTRPQSAEFLVAQGSALARTGKVEEAIEKFNRAQQLDAKLVFDAVARATELAEWG